jgi:hypothetical protein
VPQCQVTGKLLQHTVIHSKWSRIFSSLVLKQANLKQRSTSQQHAPQVAYVAFCILLKSMLIPPS